jgi:hypothetical protein
MGCLLRFGAPGAIGEFAVADASLDDRSQPTLEKMNRVGMPASEMVQLDEIVVILGMQLVGGAPGGAKSRISSDRLP